MFNYNEYYNKHKDDLTRSIQCEIGRKAKLQYYQDCKPFTLAQYYDFLLSCGAFGCVQLNYIAILQSRLNLPRTRAQRIARIVMQWLMSDYVPARLQ